MLLKFLLLFFCGFLSLGFTVIAWGQSVPSPEGWQGGLTNPDSPASQLAELRFQVQGMDPLTSTQIEGALKKIDGVWDAVADWKPGNVFVKYDPAKVDSEAIYAEVYGRGFLVTTPLPSLVEPKSPDPNDVGTTDDMMEEDQY